MNVAIFLDEVNEFNGPLMRGGRDRVSRPFSRWG